MYQTDLVDIPFEVFGGYCPAIPPADLAPGAAAIAQDVIFPQGAVRSRGGLRNAYPGSIIPANAAINGMSTYLNPSGAASSSGVLNLMAWDSLGNLYQDTSGAPVGAGGGLTLVASRPSALGLFYQSTHLFSREYQAFYQAGFNGLFDIPRQYDGTNWDRVSQVGPGVAPTAVDGAAGNIPAGKHQLSVSFITRQGFITQAAPPTSWTAAGSKQANLSNIATGPPNVVARLLHFSTVIVAPAAVGTLFSLPNGSTQVASSTMLINDNVSTTATVDFTDTILAAGFNANYLLTQLELGEVSGFAGYNSRLVAWGERSKVNNFNNLTFDGGFSGATPRGWTNVSAGGGSAIAGGFTADWGDAYSITGDGATAVRGKITQSAFADYLQVPIIQPNSKYFVRARVKGTGLSQGTLHINLQSTSGAFTTVGLAIAAGQLNAPNYFEFFGNITDAPLAKPPSDLLLQVYADGTPTNGGVFLVDSIEVYGVSYLNDSTARVSHAFNPESYDATTGQIQIRPGDGQQIKAAFPIRSNLYFAKDHYLCYVTDDGVNEPASWAVNEVSATIGICGSNALDWTEEWAVFAERSGMYICWGSDPVKITPEIQNDASGAFLSAITWASINWAAAWTMWVRIDKVNKMILVGAPVNGATTPNVVFMMDYKWLESAQDIAASPLVTYSAFTGKILAHGRGRRWAVWNITANSMTFAERIDGTAQPFFGNGSTNGKIYQQFDASLQPSDDGVAIPWTYQSYGCPSHLEEQMMSLGAHRKLAGYLKFRAIGSGSMPLAITTARLSQLLRSYTLSTSPADGERPLNIHGERFFITVGTNGDANSWFQLEKLILCVKKDSSMVVRGVSA